MGIFFATQQLCKSTIGDLTDLAARLKRRAGSGKKIDLCRPFVKRRKEVLAHVQNDADTHRGGHQDTGKNDGQPLRMEAQANDGLGGRLHCTQLWSVVTNSRTRPWQ